MDVMPSERAITLKEVQLRLGTPQHVLIHLCEKGVVEPDFSDTAGRGKRREFSERNLFEFAVALELRKIELPVATVGLLVRVLRSFIRAVKGHPELRFPDAPIELGLSARLHLFDGDVLVLNLAGHTREAHVLLSAKLTRGDSAPRVAKIKSLPEGYTTRLDVDLTKIARDVLADLKR
ncbi:MAG TPA: hypothetical protein VHM25_08600 [Polyangiaceae bacterium]|jgi:hypothetical protein|nr:hypothetical protein [Polyangiaceae bacterium]